MVVLGRIVGILMLGVALSYFLLFVMRLPAVWSPGYNDSLAVRGPSLSKANLNRGQFMIHFHLWVYRSRIRSAIVSAFLGYAGWCVWTGHPPVPA